MSEGDIVAVPLANGRFGLVHVIEVDGDGNVTFLVMDGFWDELPDARAAAAARPARYPAPVRLPGYDDIWKGWFRGAVPGDFGTVGRRAPSAEELAYVKNTSGTMIFGTPNDLRDELHRAWRLQYDRPALEAEWAAAGAARARRATDRRKTLTLAKLLREPVFPGRSSRLSVRVAREVRRIFRDATQDLIALQASGTKRERTAVLRRITTELNALDDGEGFIETVEAELLISRIEELAALVGLSNEDERLTSRRDW
jgi:hypothetical protein